MGDYESVSLGGMMLANQTFGTETESAWIGVESAASAGLLSYEFIKRAILTIDHAGSVSSPVNELSSDKAGTAASANVAGIKVGEEITKVAGTLAAKVEIYDLRETFKEAPGTKIALTVKGKDGERKVELTLADQV